MRLFFTKILTRKNAVYAIVAAIILTAGCLLFLNNKNHEQVLVARPADFLQQVSASGKVVARQNLNLSFEQTGQVSGVYARVGDRINQGQLMANQNTVELSAELSEAQAGIGLQKAKLNQLLAGASEEDINAAQNKVASAEQDLDNAYVNALADISGVYTLMYNSYTTVLYIQDTYFFTTGDQQGFRVKNHKEIINKTILDAKTNLEKAQNATSNNDQDAAISNIIANLRAIYNSLEVIRQQCQEDVYYSRVSLVDKTSLDTQKTNISGAIGDMILTQSGVASYKIALSQAKETLAVKKAPPRSSDIAVFEAEIKQAKASEQNILARLKKKEIYSPIRGIITAVNVKVGSVFSANDVAVSVIGVNDFQIESYIPEINISLIKVGDLAAMALDAYGQDVFFPAKVISIDPAETIKDGVSTYKVTLEFINNDQRVKSGMTGNIVVTTNKKSNVISIPQGIITIKDGKKFIKIKEGDRVVEKNIETGLVSSLGNAEVISGINDGDVVVIKEGD